MADLPACVTSCQGRLLAAEPICTYNEVFNSRLTRCVQTTCPTLEGVLQWQTHYAAACNLPARDQGVMEVVLAYVLFGVASISVIGRLLSRWKRLNGPGFWWDDWMVLVLWVLSIELVVCLVFLRDNWAGRDAIDFVGRHHIEELLKWVYISEPFYIIGTWGSKIVWVMLYMRMWDANTMFRKLCWGTIFLLSAGLIGFTVAAIATFWPWHFYIGDSAIVRRYQGGIDLIPAVLSIGVLNVALDFWVLLLPVPKLIALKGVPRRRKAGICAIFLLGFVVTACSLVRFTTILPLRHSTNATWDFGHFGTWSEIEVHLSMVSCNLPAMAGLVHRLRWRRRRNNTTYGDGHSTTYESGRSTATGTEISVADQSSSADATLCEDPNSQIILQRHEEKSPD